MQRFALTIALLSLMAIAPRAGLADELRLPGPLPAVAHPADNPATPEKIALGKRLFHDPRLSRTGKMSCATCHDPAQGFADGRALPLGVDGRPAARHAPSLVNVAFRKRLFWDGRAASLEAQAFEPIQNPREMDLSLAELERRLNERPDDRRDFQRIFGGPPTADRAAQALAAFERTIVVRDTPFDRYLAGEQEALPAAAERGMRLFYGRASCHECHGGPELSDREFHNVGIVDPARPDSGRRSVTGREADEGAFQTPGLREIGRTSPYMHDGRFKTLREVVTHYNFGGVTDAPNDHRDRKLQVLYLTPDEVADLVAFLERGLTRGR